MIEPIIFFFVSLWFAYLSRASLRVPHSHGFYRFFAWEFILALILLNARLWFHDPLSVHQIIAWLLLILATFWVISGAYHLRTRGKRDDKREEAPLMSFEKTSELVTTGTYKYIRHPLYSSLLFLAWGVFSKDPGFWGGALALAATIFLVATAKADEKECINYFGPAYRSYMANTKMFVPFLF